MSLNPCSIEPVPEETARVARAAFPKGNRYMTMRDVGDLGEEPVEQPEVAPSNADNRRLRIIITHNRLTIESANTLDDMEAETNRTAGAIARSG